VHAQNLFLQVKVLEPNNTNLIDYVFILEALAEGNLARICMKF
jgi:hypothetical protein